MLQITVSILKLCCSNTMLFLVIHKLHVIAKKVSIQYFFLILTCIFWFIHMSYICRSVPGIIIGFLSYEDNTHQICHDTWHETSKWSKLSTVVAQKLHVLASIGSIPFLYSRSLVFSLPNNANHIINSTLGGASFLQIVHTKLSTTACWSLIACALADMALMWCNSIIRTYWFKLVMRDLTTFCFIIWTYYISLVKFPIHLLCLYFSHKLAENSTLNLQDTYLDIELLTPSSIPWLWIFLSRRHTFMHPLRFIKLVVQ